MIWVGGKIVADDALSISALDRTFEHGLGLFETLRSWGGDAPLLDRHLERLARSARVLGLPLDPASLPTRVDVASLLGASGGAEDRVLRITMSGGIGALERSIVWMRALPLPPPTRREGAIVEVGAWPVLVDDPMARHKSLNYWSRRLAHEAATRRGFDEAIGSSGPPGARLVWEGSRTNLFAIHEDRLRAPTTEGPIVPGIMRGLVLELAQALALDVAANEPLGLASLAGADEVFLTNSVRGVIPVGRLVHSQAAFAPISWRAPGPWTRRLALALENFVRAGGDSP